MNYHWIIINIGEIQTVWKNNIEKRTVVLEEVNDKDYKGGIAFDLMKDKVNLIDGVKIGDTVEVSLNFRANEYKGKYYNNITAWSIKKVSWWSVMEDSTWDLPF